MRQRWENLLFLHWSLDPEFLSSFLPPGLELDLFEGKAWLGVVPFDMKGVTVRGLPAPSAFCDFPEINLRTYVSHGDKPGVWFFNLDVNHASAVWAARTFFHLPYYKAEMTCKVSADTVEYQHRREALRFHARYRGHERVEVPDGSFEAWATSRYALYCQSRSGHLYRGEIYHDPWPLQRAEVELFENTFLDGFPVEEAHPVALFSESLDVRIFPLQRL